MIPPRLGIGVVTYNRCELLAQTLRAIAEHTTEPYELVVADDGSEDGTHAHLAEQRLPFIAGRNMGVTWNKNRALFHLAAVRGCDVVLLIEDDLAPSVPGWQHAWTGAVERWGHVNYGSRNLVATSLGGAGTPDDPMLCRVIQARCTGFSREAVNFVGYFDTRFRGFGHGHVEHSRRLLHAGYGGERRVIGGKPADIWYGIASGFTALDSRSYWNDAAVHANAKVLERIGAEPLYRHAWRGDAEMRQFRDELRSAAGPAHAEDLRQLFPPRPD